MLYSESWGKSVWSAHQHRNKKKVACLTSHSYGCNVSSCSFWLLPSVLSSKNPKGSFPPTIQPPQLELILNLAKALSSLSLYLCSQHFVLSDLKFPSFLLVKSLTPACRQAPCLVCLWPELWLL